MSDKNENQETEIEATGDAILISNGLHAIAEGLQAIAKALSPSEVDNPDESEPARYLDGTPMKP